MRFVLPAFVVVLSVTLYPVIRLQHSDLYQTLNLIETDLFSWYRMILLSFMIPFIFVERASLALLSYLALLLLSHFTSRFPETSLYGAPLPHEGTLALLGYIGVYQLTKKYGYSKPLEKSIDAVVYITAFISLLQVCYGNFFNFPPFRLLLPEIEVEATQWPLYANMANPNSLGLFCALIFPYALIRKKKIISLLLLTMLIGSQTRGAWLSALITTAIISRKYLLYVLGLSVLLCIPIRGDILERVKRTDLHYPIRDEDISGRAYMWKRAIPVMKDSIVLGKGPSTYLLHIPQFHERGNRIGLQGIAIDKPHNLYINIWISTGLLSLVLLGIYLIKIVRGGRDASLKCGVLGYLIAGIFTDSVLCVTPYAIIFLGGLSHEYHEARRHDQRKDAA